MNSYHLPVLLTEAVDLLNIKSNGIYVDATLGGGGHSFAILSKCAQIRLYAFDQDEDAINYAGQKLSIYPQVKIIKSNFQFLRTKLALEKIGKIDGIIFDLGVSAHQFDEATRGFSHSKNGELDMRMDQNTSISAKELINNLSEAELKEILYKYGEEANAAKIVRGIIKEREKEEITQTLTLSKIIENCTPYKLQAKTKAKVFQAFRIFVNQELQVLQKALKDAAKMLNPQGRMVVITYHSLEDRMVKQFFKQEEKDCLCPAHIPQCICQHKQTLKIITKKPITPSEEEITNNPKSRSAKLRVAERVDEV